jgi:hypothetical protein
MITFKNVNELLNEIDRDKISNEVPPNRFPARFIFLYSFAALEELTRRLHKMGATMFELGKCLPKDDGWFTKDSLIRAIENLENDSLVMPFSEIARFYNKEDFNNLFNQLAAIANPRNKPRRRIYLPLLGLQERFERDFFDRFVRKDESAPVWEVREEHYDHIKIFVAKESPTRCDILSMPVISNVREWLNAWKKPGSPSVLCLSGTLHFLYNNAHPDQIFNFEKIENKKDFLEKVFNFKVPILYDSYEDSYWEKLIETIDEKSFKSFSELVQKHLNLPVLNDKTVTRRWIENEDNSEKWLLKAYIISQDDWKEKYLYKAVRGIEHPDNHSFAKSLWLTIFDQKKPTLYTKERMTLLREIYNTKYIPLSRETENQVEKKLSEIKEEPLKKGILTGILPFEKRLLLQKFVDRHFNNVESVREKYPHLFHYNRETGFDGLKNGQDWIREYFREYKIAKLSNRYTEKIDNQIHKVNANNKGFYYWYYSFEPVREILKGLKIDQIICIDALGLEWVSLMEYFFEKKGYRVEKKLVGRVNLPSITEYNKYEADHIRDFDKQLHMDHFYHPGSIIQEIEKLIEILETHVVLDKDTSAAIISDHGASALPRLTSENPHKYTDAKHDGRYIKLAQGINFDDNPDYIVYKTDDPELKENQYILALNHNSLNRKPSKEVHGGCTPEEVLVPVIIISNKIKPLEMTGVTHYEIHPDTFEVLKKFPIISLSIRPRPNEKPALYDESKNRYELTFDPGENMWTTELKNIKAGKHIFDLTIGEFKKQLIINIPGFIEEDLF